jgi:hypothetical protein
MAEPVSSDVMTVDDKSDGPQNDCRSHPVKVNMTAKRRQRKRMKG